jgi:hypothetical protein
LILFSFEDMTQITNVLLMLIFTIFLSIIATFLTIIIDKIFDIHTLVTNIPRLITYSYFIDIK